MSKINGSFKEDNLNLINKINPDKFPSLKKELVYDMNKDKYYLYEKDLNKFYPSNSFGKKLFHIGVDDLGKLTYEQRLQKNLIEKVEIKKDNNLYHPKMKYFDGFTQIPRPLVQPFFNSNIDSRNKKQALQSKVQFLNYIRKNKSLINNNKNKEIMSRNINSKYAPPKDLNYYSNSIADCLNNRYRKDQTKKMIKFVNKSLNDEDLNINLKNPLNKFKNTLLINSNIDEINGVNIIKPNKIFLKKYRIFSNVMFITPLKKSKSEHDLQINSNSYRNLYNSINNNKLTKLIGRENNEIKNRNRIFSNRHTRKMYSVMNLKNEYNNIFEPVYHEFTKKESKRYDTEEEYKDKDIIQNETNIHTKKEMYKDYKIEKKYINIPKKDKKSIKQKPTIILRKGNPKYKSMKLIYKKELDMIKLVNPEIIKKEEYENEKRDRFLKNKIDKNRKLISNIKEKYNKTKKSRINSAETNLFKEPENF